MKLIQGDCLKVLPTLPSNSVDMVLCDLPYGITACKWDVAIPLDALWLELKRIVKLNGAILRCFVTSGYTKRWRVVTL